MKNAGTMKPSQLIIREGVDRNPATLETKTQGRKGDRSCMWWGTELGTQEASASTRWGGLNKSVPPHGGVGDSQRKKLNFQMFTFRLD